MLERDTSGTTVSLMARQSFCSQLLVFEPAAAHPLAQLRSPTTFLPRAPLQLRPSLRLSLPIPMAGGMVLLQLILLTRGRDGEVRRRCRANGTLVCRNRLFGRQNRERLHLTEYSPYAVTGYLPPDPEGRVIPGHLLQLLAAGEAVLPVVGTHGLFVLWRKSMLDPGWQPVPAGAT